MRQRKLGPAGEKIVPGMPRLWNAKRRIKANKGLSYKDHESYVKYTRSSAYRSDPSSDEKIWRPRVSEDVAAFIDTNNLTTRSKVALLKSPARYFSRPHRVPPEQRKQVYFPDFSVTLIRTPHNPPSFASFRVPLWFSKLDLKDYLSSLYGVEVVHIRSYVMPNKVLRMDPLRKGAPGKLYRPKAKKKMTVQLVEPFIWPEQVTDFEEWEKEEYWRLGRAQLENQRLQGQWGEMNPDRRHRKSVAEQARELMEGKRVWKPTWQSIPADERVLKGVADIKPPPRPMPPAIAQRAPLRQIPKESKKVPIEAPVKEFEELRV